MPHLHRFHHKEKRYRILRRKHKFEAKDKQVLPNPEEGQANLYQQTETSLNLHEPSQKQSGNNQLGETSTKHLYPKLSFKLTPEQCKTLQYIIRTTQQLDTKDTTGDAETVANQDKLGQTDTVDDEYTEAELLEMLRSPKYRELITGVLKMVKKQSAQGSSTVDNDPPLQITDSDYPTINSILHLFESQDTRQHTEVRNSQGKSDEKEIVRNTFEELYSLHERLGRGAFAEVYRAEERQTGTSYAVKVMEKAKTKNWERVTAEMEILRQVRHPNIIHLEGVFETADKIYIVTELATGGELFERVVKRGCFTEADAANLAMKMLSALAYLHSNGIVHRDLKPENILMNSEDDDTDIKIADFGLAKVLEGSDITRTACGSPNYVAPEVISSDNPGYGSKADMWSVGVIVYILLSGIPPFYNENRHLLFKSIILCDFDYPETYFSQVSDAAIDFIDNLLVPPEKRMSAAEALHHEWLRNPPNTSLDTSHTLRESRKIL